MTRVPSRTSAVPNNSASIFQPPTSSPSTTTTTTTTTTAMPGGPEPTPLPVGPNRPDEPQPQPSPARDDEKEEGSSSSSSSSQQEGQEESLLSDARPKVKLRLHILDLDHPGAARFLGAVNAADVLREGVQTVLTHLYGGAPGSEEQKGRSYVPPGTRSVTLYLEDMAGVAYTKGSDLDDDHKEIHFSLRYINSIKKAPAGATSDTTGAYEIKGVLVHELVHCFQHNGRGRCPGGLVEGVADWVRLRARLAPPHWRRDARIQPEQRWDAGYEKTAYFLDWLETTRGDGDADAVRRINEALRVGRYERRAFWEGLFGMTVEALWEEYVRAVKGG